MATIARNEYDEPLRRVLSLKGASGHLKLAQDDDMARPLQSLDVLPRREKGRAGTKKEERPTDGVGGMPYFTS